MKICFLGDTHFGHKNGDKVFADFQRKFYTKIFFPYIKKNKIERIIQFGDFFDSRKAIRHSTMKLVREVIIDNSYDATNNVCIKWDVNVGNHDIHMKDSIHPNACTELLSIYPNFNIIDKPTTLSFDKLDIDIIPWICKENKEEVFEFIKSSLSLYCIGHFELNGFQYAKGILSEGFSPDFLEHYIQVWSGHYHTESEGGNVHYIGNPYQMSFSDSDEERGFWIFDTISKNMEFVVNPYNLYTKVYYDSNTFDLNSISNYIDMNVKIIVEDRGNAAQFDNVVELFSKVTASQSVIDNIDVIQNNDLKIDITDTLKIISDYIDELTETTKNKKEIKKIMTALYKEGIGE